jgi:hypothetical protein
MKLRTSVAFVRSADLSPDSGGQAPGLRRAPSPPSRANILVARRPERPPQAKGLALIVLLAVFLLGGAVSLHAQPTVAPTNEPVGPARGENTPGYNVRQSFELGYRWRTVDGDLGMYRSTVNYGNGIRLLSSSLDVQSREGHGRFYDSLLLNTQGLGNDPYQYANLRVEKNRLYRYDLTWRSNAYYNPALTIANGRHFMDTVRNVQDQDLTIFPQSSFRFFLGYSRVSQNGPGLSTVNLFQQHRGDEFVTFADIRRQQNEYRLGTEIRALGFRLNVLHAWVNFKEDTPNALNGLTQGANTTDLNTLTSFRRNEPYHGNSPYWRVALFRDGRIWAVNGRFTYVSGRRAFVTDELANGMVQVGAGVANFQRQVLSFGNARRPAATGNLTFSLFPGSNITITNQTSVYNIRMEGDSYFAQSDNGAAPRPVVNFQYLGIRTIANSTDAELRAGKRFAVHAGFTYDDRRISSVEGFEVPPTPAPASARVPFERTNLLRAGILGFRFRPIQPVTINVDGEIGRADSPFFPISEKNYQALRARIEYKRRNFRAAAFARTFYNTNSASLANYASRSRQEGADLTWTARSWLSFDASYSKQHLDTLAAIDYFAVLTGFRSEEVTSDLSYYVSNIHAGTLSAHFNLGSRADVSIGYSHIQDTGDGRATPVGDARYATLPSFQAAQTFPLRFNSPLGRLSIRIRDNIRWNAGYQFYGYRQEFSGFQAYRAHTGYTSVSWSF